MDKVPMFADGDVGRSVAGIVDQLKNLKEIEKREKINDTIEGLNRDAVSLRTP